MQPPWPVRERETPTQVRAAMGVRGGRPAHGRQCRRLQDGAVTVEARCVERRVPGAVDAVDRRAGIAEQLGTFEPVVVADCVEGRLTVRVGLVDLGASSDEDQCAALLPMEARGEERCEPVVVARDDIGTGAYQQLGAFRVPPEAGSVQRCAAIDSGAAIDRLIDRLAPREKRCDAVSMALKARLKEQAVCVALRTGRAQRRPSKFGAVRGLQHLDRSGLNRCTRRHPSHPVG